MSKILSEVLAADARYSAGFGDKGALTIFIDWLTFADPTSAVTTDVRRIRNHPLVPNRIPIYGFVYDVKTGKLIEVSEATKIGAAKA